MLKLCAQKPLKQKNELPLSKQKGNRSWPMYHPSLWAHVPYPSPPAFLSFLTDVAPPISFSKHPPSLSVICVAPLASLVVCITKRRVCHRSYTTYPCLSLLPHPSIAEIGAASQDASAQHR